MRAQNHSFPFKAHAPKCEIMDLSFSFFSSKTQRQREAAENLQNKGGEAGAEEEPEEEM